jgi:hypothetical protein
MQEKTLKMYRLFLAISLALIGVYLLVVVPVRDPCQAPAARAMVL